MGGEPRRKEQGIERWSAPELGTLWAHTHVREILVLGNRLKRMVGWDGIEPPTPGFSDLGLRLGKCAQVLTVARTDPDGLVRWNEPE